MKRYAITLLALALFQLHASAQELEPTEFMGRANVGVDWKIVKGLHLSADYELRTKDAFSGIERHQADVGLSYKVNDWFRAGTGYTYIAHFNSSDELKSRHRAYLDLIGSLNAGYWRFSLRERLQLTNKSYDINEYQDPRNDVSLKSRFKVMYRGHQILGPYTYVELRNTFNAASYNAEYVPETGKYTNYEFTGYNYAYINRVRLALGIDFRLGKHHDIDFCFLADRNFDRELDVNKAGTKLKSVTWHNYWGLNLCLGYVFSF